MVRFEIDKKSFGEFISMLRKEKSMTQKELASGLLVSDKAVSKWETDYLIYNDPIAYADLILNGDPAIYLKTVTEYKSLD